MMIIVNIERITSLSRVSRGYGRHSLISLLTQHLSLSFTCGTAPFCRPAMSSPPTTPTVSSATSTTSSTSSPTSSSSNDGNGGPSSSLYLYVRPFRTKPSFTHICSSRTRILLLSTSEMMVSTKQVYLPRDVILTLIRLVRDYTSIFHPSSSF